MRTVKPELFLDEELGKLSGDHLALFVGLWTQADREGRLEERPERLKAVLFPYRPVDVLALLADLDAIGKIARYDVHGVRLVWVCGFKNHQRPHPKEPASELPAFPGREKPRPAVERNSLGGGASVGREGKGREGNMYGSGKGTACADPLVDPPPAALEKVITPPAERKPPATTEATSPATAHVAPGAILSAAAEQCGAPPLIERLEAVFVRLRGVRYPRTKSDNDALRMLLEWAYGDEGMIETKWEQALQRTTYPRCSTLKELADPKVWGASPEEVRTGGGFGKPPAFNRNQGIMSAPAEAPASKVCRVCGAESDGFELCETHDNEMQAAVPARGAFANRLPGDVEAWISAKRGEAA